MSSQPTGGQGAVMEHIPEAGKNRAYHPACAEPARREVGFTIRSARNPGSGIVQPLPAGERSCHTADQRKNGLAQHSPVRILIIRRCHRKGAETAKDLRRNFLAAFAPYASRILWRLAFGPCAMVVFQEGQVFAEFVHLRALGKYFGPMASARRRKRLGTSIPLLLLGQDYEHAVERDGQRGIHTPQVFFHQGATQQRQLVAVQARAMSPM